MDVRDCVELIRPKLPFLILGALLAGLSCAIFYPRWLSYEASATLLLQDTVLLQDTGPLQDTLSHRPILDSQRLKIDQKTLSTLATRAPITDRVVDILDLDISAKSLGERIQVRTPENTAIVEIAIAYGNPVVATSIVNTLLQELRAHPDLTVKTQIIALAEIPQRPIQSFYLLVIIATALGFTISTCAVFVGDFLNNVVRHERDIEKKLGIPILGKIEVNQKSDNRSKQTTLQSYQWIFMNVFMNSLTTPDTLFVTSAKKSDFQSSFVHKLVTKNLNEEFQREEYGDLSDRSPYSEAADRAIESTHPVTMEPGPFYELEIDEVPLNISDAKHRFCRYIKVVDGPPLLSNPNTMILAQRFDSVLLVIEENKTKISDLQKTKQLLNNSGIPIIGSVLLTE